MNKTSYLELPIFVLLIVSKLSSTYINISPFIAVIVVGVYFVTNEYKLLLMIFIVQFISDLHYGLHISNLSVYISYLIMTWMLYKGKRIFSLHRSLILGLYANLIFYVVTNFGHFLAYSDVYSSTSLSDTYYQGLIFGVYLLLSTIIFIIVFHTLLAVSRKQLVRSRSTRS